MPKFRVGFILLAPPLILSVLALMGWVLDMSSLTSGFTTGVSMNPATAVCFILLSFEASRLIAENNTPFISRAGKLAIGLVVVASAMQLSDIMFDTSFGIEAKLFATKVAARNAHTAGMAPSTVSCFLVLGFSLLFMRGWSNLSIRIAQGLAAIPLFIAMVAIIGYFYGFKSFYTVGNFFNPMAFNTVVSFIFLSGTVFAYPIKGFRRLFTEVSPMLHTKILYLFLPVTLLPLVVIAFFTYQRAGAALKDEIHGFLDGYANQQTRLLENYVKERMGDVNVIVRNPIYKATLIKLEEAFSKNGTGSPVYLDLKNEVLPLTRQILDAYGYYNFYMISPDGDVIFSTKPSKLFGINVFSEPTKGMELSRLVKTVLETKTAGIAKFDFYPELDQKISGFVAAPIIQGETVVGVVALRFAPDSIYQIASDYTGLGETGEMTLGIKIGDEVVFIAPTRFDPNAAFKYRAKIGPEIALPMQNAVLEKNGSGYAVDYRGHAVWAAWRYLPSLKLGIVVKKDVKEINAETEPIKKFSLFLTLVTFLLAVGMADYVAKSITKPIESLTSTTRLIADGNLQERAKVEEQNEIGILADSFNRMAVKLENSYARIHSVVANAMDGIITISDDGRIESFNPAAERIFGYAADELIGKNINLLMPEPYRTEHDGYLKKHLRTGQSKILGMARKVPALRKNGEVFPLETSVSETFLGGQRLFTGIVRDITERNRAEEEIRKLSHAMEQSPISIVITDTDGNIEYVNNKFQELTGYTRNELLGKNPRALKSGVQSKEFYQDLWRKISSGMEWHGEFCNKKKNGELFWERATISPIKNAAGVITHYIGLKEDITAHKLAEEALRKSEMELRVVRERLDLAIRGSYDGLWDWSTRESDPIWCSPIFYQMLGYEDGEFVMTLQKFIELIHEEDKARVVKAIGDHLAQKSNDLYHVEFRLRTKLGDYRWYIARGQALWDANGNPTRFAGSMRDITERKRIETELQQHRDHLKEMVELRTHQLTMENLDRRQAEESLARTLREQNTIFSTNPDIIYVADLHACMVKWNKSLETVTGYSPEEIVGKKCISFFPPQEADLVASAIAKVMSEGKGEVEAHLLCKSGALIPYHFNGVPLRNENGGIIGFTGTGRDITERRQAEERVKKIYEQLIHSEKLSALGKLTGSIAHEFNNPIYGLRNIIEQTREEEGLDEEITGLLDLALRECDRMAGLVRKLQGFYKPSDDTRTVVDIHQLLGDIEALTRKKLQVKGIELVKNYCPDLPEVDVVEDQIKQVLLNLINNAEEAISGENGKITITTEVNGANIEVHVKDTGEGIPEENLKLIFEPFFSTKGIKGTGLGLSVCYGIVNAHGGTIEVTSKRGAGSTFTLRLPIQGEV